MVDSFRCRSRIRNKTLETGGHICTGRRRIRQEYHNGSFHDDFTLQVPATNSFQETHVLDDEFALECLRSHNHFRTQHGCSPLHLSVEVSRFSQQWADRLAVEDHLHHSHHSRYGENLFVTYLSDNSLPMTRGNEVVESWYSEHKYYPFDGYVSRETLQKTGTISDSFWSHVGHFTQVVWSNSRELGVGKAASKSNRVYVVANYCPAGNITNKVRSNVPQRILGTSANHHPHYSNRLFTKATRLYFDSWIEY